MGAGSNKKALGERPNLNPDISLDDYLNYYWLKAEMVSFCRKVGINPDGWKLEIHDRIIEYLTTRKIVKKKVSSTKVQSNDEVFNITLDTIVNSSFKRNPETTAFFKEVDSRFHYSVRLNQYIRNNIGEITYGDIIVEWKKEHNQKRRGIKTTPDLPQCEYNQFIKDYLADNKNRCFKDAVNAWNVKKKMRGDNIYHREELSLYSLQSEEITKEYQNGME